MGRYEEHGRRQEKKLAKQYAQNTEKAGPKREREKAKQRNFNGDRKSWEKYF